jgi:flagellar motor switch protein FliN/FliY
MNPRFAAAAQIITDLWREEFRKVMEAMADLRPELELKTGEGIPATPDVLWWSQPFDAAEGAGVWVGAEQPAWAHLGQQILTAAGIDSAAEQEVRSTFLEVLRQSLSSLGTELGAHIGREVTTKEGAEEEPQYGNAEEYRFHLEARGVVLPEVHFWISRQLLEAMARRASEARVEERAPEREEAPSAAAGAMDLQLPASSTLDLLLDVEMPVSVSFGRTQIRLQDALKLISGSIIELDRSISEPVQVIVNNCVIASGEVVVVDGNYGVRIQEIMSRRGRLEQSRRYMLPLNRNHVEIGG